MAFCSVNIHQYPPSGLQIIIKYSVELSCALTFLFRITYCVAAKDCGLLAVPMNGSTTGGDTTYPNEVTFDCEDGFIMSGSRIRKCQSNGIWSGNETSCTGN